MARFRVLLGTVGLVMRRSPAVSKTQNLTMPGVDSRTESEGGGAGEQERRGSLPAEPDVDSIRYPSWS
jgi:hypothetical protein